MKIIFVCSGNTCRSPMAEGIAKKIAGENSCDIEIMSRGLFADDGAFPAFNAVSALKNMGIDISKHRAKRFETDDLSADKIICMDQMIFGLLFGKVDETKLELLGNGINDPYGQELDVYEKCAAKIQEELTKLNYFDK